MLRAYIAYPNPHLNLHRDPKCTEAEKMYKLGKRHVRLNLGSLSEELLRFARKEHSFSASPGMNDLWLTADFADAEFETAVVKHLLQHIAKGYSPFSRAVLKEHC